MTKEEQRIAIAEACGWKEHQAGMGPPDYLDDLNAMHEAEKLLNTRHLMHAYVLTLCQIIPCMDGSPDQIRSTASQRAEAFLRTIGKWSE